MSQNAPICRNSQVKHLKNISLKQEKEYQILKLEFKKLLISLEELSRSL